MIRSIRRLDVSVIIYMTSFHLTALLACIAIHSAWMPCPTLAANIDPTITLFRNKPGGDWQLQFTGLLQSSRALSGPWTDLPNASSPHTPNTKSDQLFFRSRQPAVESVFASRDVLEWTLTAPFQTNFNLAFAGTPDGIFPPKRTKPPFNGTLTLQGSDLPLTLRVRGNSSLQECPFPKLTLKVGRDERIDTPFYDAREIKIGTHCADGGRGNIGRLRDERAPYREALAYEVMQSLGFISPRVRRVHIDFHDTSSTNAPTFGGWQITRNGMILDDPEVVGERLGGRALEDDEISALLDAQFSEQLISDLKLLHVLLGNWDYSLSTTGEGLWNTDVIELADLTLIPIAGDFDLASWVTEFPRVIAPRDYLPNLPDLDRNARYSFEVLHRSTPAEIVQASVQRFVNHRDTLQALVENAVIDPAGKTNALAHLQSFFQAVQP